MVPQLPTEIWLHVARYIPDDGLGDLLAVNHVFFDLAMTQRYKSVVLKKFDAHCMALVSHLSSALVSKRVKSLQLKLNRLDRQLISSTPPRPSSLRGTTILRAAQRLTRSRPGVSVTSKRSPFGQVVEGLSAKFPTFTHLEEFSIDSWNLSVEINLHPFFSSAWLTFGRNLRRLSLGGNLDGYRILYESKPVLDSLQELSLEFTDSLNPAFSGLIPDRDVLTSCVAPFINKVLPHLTLLKIWSWASTDLSDLFLSITPSPGLHSIDILGAFNRSFGGDPAGLTNLLYACQDKLHTLKLRLHPSGFPNQVSDLELSHWFSQTVNNDPGFASQLRLLHIYPSGSREGLDTLMLCVQRSFNTLHTLIIKDRYLHQEEVFLLCSALPVGLTFLQMNIFSLSGVILDAIGKRFPNLHELGLYMARPVVMDEATRVNGHAIKPENQKLKVLRILQGGNHLDDQTLRAIRLRLLSPH